MVIFAAVVTPVNENELVVISTGFPSGSCVFNLNPPRGSLLIGLLKLLTVNVIGVVVVLSTIAGIVYCMLNTLSLGRNTTVPIVRDVLVTEGGLDGSF